MKHSIPMNMLKEVSSDIANGRPVWGILRANEYLSKASPLARALGLQARRQLGAGLPHRVEPLIERLLQGQTLSEFDFNERQALLALDLPVGARKKEVSPRPRRRSAYSNKTLSGSRYLLCG